MKRAFRRARAAIVARTRISAICGLCNRVYKDANCPHCGEVRMKKQHFFVDGPSEGLYAAETGFPYAGHTEPGKKTLRVCPSKRAWKEYIARSEGTREDVS